MKRLISVLALGAALGALFTGCTPTLAPLGQAFVKTAAYTGVAVGVKDHPEVVPFVRIGIDQICASANGTNVSPTKIVADLEATHIGTNQITWFIINGAIGLYTSVYAFYGDDIANYPILVGYLHAICDGGSQGLPPETMTARALSAIKPEKYLPPHLK